MVVGVLRLTFVVPGAHSLKEKRHAVRKMTDRVRARYNVSIAEVGENEVWQRAVLGVTAVANDSRFVNEVLDKVVRDCESAAVAHLVNREMEIEIYNEMSATWHEKPMLDEPPVPPPDGDEPFPEELEGQRGYLTEDDLP
jgi:uncharacterized protein YlxP (DUF503 family)